MKKTHVIWITAAIMGIATIIFGIVYLSMPKEEVTEEPQVTNQPEKDTTVEGVLRESLDVYDDETDVALEEYLSRLDEANANVEYTFTDEKIVITSNGLPDHEIGDFPNSLNPNALSEQNYSVIISRLPFPQGEPKEIRVFGIAVNGILLEPGMSETDPTTGWGVEAINSLNTFGLDQNNGSVQSSGLYQYKGIPLALVAGTDSTSHSPLIGFASDGYPIYAQYGYLDPAGTIRDIIEYTSSWKLREGVRAEGEPAGNYDGTYTQDFAYQPGSGLLDKCNGTFTVTPEFPDGTYAYFLTNTFPFIPRCVSGIPNDSFENVSQQSQIQDQNSDQ